MMGVHESLCNANINFPRLNKYEQQFFFVVLEIICFDKTADYTYELNEDTASIITVFCFEKVTIY